jgi:hypothetical protein
LSLGQNGNIQVNPGGKQGVVHLNLDKEDKMVIETFNDGTMTMNFEGTDGTKLKMTAKNHFITIKFTDKDGNPFEFSSDGYEFTIPGLKLDITGYKLVATSAVVYGDGETPQAIR